MLHYFDLSQESIFHNLLFYIINASVFVNYQISSLLKKLCSVLLIKSSYWTFEVNFGLSIFFIILILKYIFLQHFVETFLGLRFGRSSFLIISIFSYFTHRKLTSSLKISNLNCNLYQMALDHFRGYIWNQHTMLVTILREELEDPKYHQPTTHPSIHPDKGFRRFEIVELRCF